MKNIPKRIFLNLGDIKGLGIKDFNELEVTWCVDRIYDSDIEYVRVPKNKNSKK